MIQSPLSVIKKISVTSIAIQFHICNDIFSVNNLMKSLLTMFPQVYRPDRPFVFFIFCCQVKIISARQTCLSPPSTQNMKCRPCSQVLTLYSIENDLSPIVDNLIMKGAPDMIFMTS